MIRLSIANRALGLRGGIVLPASKSISNRALLLSQLCADGPAPLSNLADCEDTRVMREALKALSELRSVNSEQIIDVRGAGTAMRFLTAYFAQCEGANVVLTGIERMKQRPIAPLVNALRALGADISYMEKEGCPPLHIRGCRLKGDTICVDGSISSQYVSALLMIAPMTHASRLTLTGRIVSRPYIEMTRALMAHFGVQTTWEDEHTLLIPSSTYRAKPLTIEGDWSAASYWLAFEAIAKQQNIPYDVTLEGLQTPSLQGDSVCAELLRSIRQIDFTNCPDLVQTMAVAYCLLGKPFVFTGTESLRIKETDRIAALITELGKLGYELHYEDGTLKWEGNKSPQVPKSIATYNDHRMAMAFALAAMTQDSVLIESPEVVSKSYPGFWDDLRKVGFKVEEIKKLEIRN
jgi:5-enolpyruvylshikimate-3-phosphate synthase